MREKELLLPSRLPRGSINTFTRIETNKRPHVVYESDALNMQVLPIKRVLK